jgi:tRNA(fMet)-specific endonuclease VapC
MDRQTKLMLDTNIVSYMMKEHTLAKAYVPHLRGRVLAISFITVGEMYYGAEKDGWGERRRAALETQLRNFMVVPYDHQIARAYGLVVAEREKKGMRIEPNDAWIAACAVRHEVPLVTHNAKDFREITGLTVISESSG